MRAAPRDEISKGNEWKIYEYVTRHFIASLHDDCEYLERKLNVDLNGYNFSYTWHEMVDRGFLFAMPWKQRSMSLNEVNMNTRQMNEGMQVPVGGLNTETQYTKPPDYLQESELIALMDQHGKGIVSLTFIHQNQFQTHNIIIIFFIHKNNSFFNSYRYWD